MRRSVICHLLWFLLLIACAHSADQANRANLSPVDLVYPCIDASNSRWFFFSSASRPFGMVNLSPDMLVEGTWGTGYRYNEDTIRCFSHVHGWQLSGIPVLPTTGVFKGHLGSDAYGSRYRHEKETVRPGYHKLHLDSYDITAELTSTTRVGFHRYTFPASAQSHILFDFSTHLGPSGTAKGFVEMAGDTQLEGYAIMEGTARRPKPLMIFFVAEFDKPFDSFRGWKDGKLLDTPADVVDGVSTGAYVTFSTKAQEQRLMKVAISYVSIEQARLNMEVELPHWDFDKVANESRADWNQWLSRIKIDGGTENDQRRFYTDLWKALQGRRIISDVNGKYCDMTGPERRIGQIPLDENGRPRFNHHNSDAFWGAQWTLNTLWHLVYPEVTESFINSMLLMYDDGGLIPRGPSGGNYTYVMTGASSTPFIVSAYLKGIRGFDVDKAFEGLRKNHLPRGLMSKAGYEHNSFKGGGIEEYISRGYVPHPLDSVRHGFHQDGSAQTLEYAYQDFALSSLAQVLGKEEDYRMFRRRAENYRNLWNSELGWMWVKDRHGNWREPADVLEYGKGWVEGNAAQYTWFVPHDVQGLIGLMGGKDKFTKKLNASFTAAMKHDFVSGKSHDVETTQRNREVFINYGNQPSIQTAYLFNYAGSPWLTQYWSRQVVDKVYGDLSPDAGYSGDEDQGLMSSLAVLMKSGIFSVNGGTSPEPFYDIGSPLFDRISIALNPDYYGGKEIVIETAGNGPENYYVQSATWNGQPMDRAWILHSDFVKGGTLRLEMGAEPNKGWASAAGTEPPSMSSASRKAFASAQSTESKVLYDTPLSSEEELKDWIMEGPGKLTFDDGWMRMNSPGEEWHHVLWCPAVFPARFVAEWEVQNVHPEEGLLIVFFATTGLNGEDIFDPVLPTRDGTFKLYTKDKLKGYHISYYANNPKNPDREFAHLRKNNAFALVQTGAMGIPKRSTNIHRIRLVKDDNHILFFVDDRPVINWQDDGKAFGPAHGAGRIGFRQMQWSDFRYRNFRVRELHPDESFDGLNANLR